MGSTRTPFLENIPYSLEESFVPGTYIQRVDENSPRDGDLFKAIVTQKKRGQEPAGGQTVGTVHRYAPLVEVVGPVINRDPLMRRRCALPTVAKR
jgi:hypothetical protein